MKLIATLLFISFLCPSILALNMSTFEADHCKEMIWNVQRSGRFQVQEPLFFESEEGKHSIQRVMYNNEPIILWRTPTKVIKLGGNISKVRDFIIHEGDLWLLSREQVISFSQNGKIQGQFTFQAGLSSRDFPHSLVAVDDKFYIAHGGIGLVSFDPLTEAFSFVSAVKTEQEKGVSLAISLFYDKKSSHLVVLHTADSQWGFNGLAAFDLAGNSIVHELEYSRRRNGVIDRYALIYGHDDSIYINNGGWIHQLKKLSNSRQRPRWLAIRDDRNGRRGYGRIRGDFLFNEDSILGCSMIVPENSGTKIKGKLISREL